MALSGPAVTAIASMAALNFVLVDFGASIYIQRPLDRGGFTYFAGMHSSDFWTGLSAAAIAGAALATSITNDETARLALGTPTWGRPGSRAAG
jgi:hypothetical protein